MSSWLVAKVVRYGHAAVLIKQDDQTCEEIFYGFAWLLFAPCYFGNVNFIGEGGPQGVEECVESVDVCCINNIIPVC